MLAKLNQITSSKIWTPSLLVLIVLVAILLRFYKLQNWMYFMIDEERDAFVVRNMIVHHKPTLIGNSVPGGLYLPPVYYYFSAIAFALGNFDPLSWGITAALFGSFLVIFFYLVGRKLFGPRAALISTLLYATSYLNIWQNRIYWPLMMPPLTSLLVYLGLSQLYQRKKQYSLLIFLTLAVGIGYDSSVISLFLLTLVMAVSHQLKFKTRYTLVGTSVLAFVFLPLVVFNFRHQNFLVKAAANFFNPQKAAVQFSATPLINSGKSFLTTFSRVLLVSSDNDIAKQINPCPQFVSLRQHDVSPGLIILITASLSFLVANIILQKQSFAAKMILLHFLLVIFGIALFNLFYGSYIHEWFFYIVFPAFFLTTGLFLAWLWKKLPLASGAIIVALVFLNTYTFFTGTNSQGYSQKIAAVEYAIGQVADKPFFLDSIGSCFNFGGYRYLFSLKGKQPLHSFMDAQYAGWLYPQPTSKPQAEIGVVFVHQEGEPTQLIQNYQQYQERSITSKQIGSLEVLIVKP